MRRHALPLLIFLCAAAVGCGGDAPLEPCTPAQSSLSGLAAAPALLGASPLDALFASAGERFGVDAALLKAIAWTETRLVHVIPEHADEPLDHHGQPAAWGVMALRGERLERAAQRAVLEVADVQGSAEANILAAAALLAAEARAAGVADRPAEQWAPALEHFSGIELPAGRAAYAHAVLAALLRVRPQPDQGGAGTAAGEPCAAPRPPPPPDPPGTLFTWRASPNFNQRTSGAGGQITMVIVHTCEGAYVGCWSWLVNPASQVSAHYVVNEEGTEISQLVDEPARAWHIGATYDCALNRSRRCDLNGVQSNHFTIGIEHAGFAAQTSFPSQQIDVSAQLLCEITRRHAIPRDFQHIVAHGQLQPWNRTDPGRNWPWVRYVTLAQRHCGEIVVDDDVAFNESAYARTTSSPAWSEASATAGYYGAGYRFAPTTADADDPLVFEFRTDSAGVRTIEARWTAGSNRSSAARFSVKSGSVTLATTTHDQRTSHETWQPIAMLQLPAGWHRVELSRLGETGNVVVADAIRVR